MAVAASGEIGGGGTEGIDGKRCQYDTESLDGNKELSSGEPNNTALNEDQEPFSTCRRRRM
jgi:hypothetical protein